jgi:NAD(P)-dependent dehydrogenase (short-subunit alcohol dehydrogenase family)
MADLTADELRRCIQILSAVVDDRTTMSVLTDEERIALVKVAGRLSRPTRHETERVAKAFRRIERKHNQAKDRQARAGTAIRTARLAEVFTAPAQLSGGAAATETPDLIQARDCYVCKTEFRKLHFFYDSMCAACGEHNYAKRFQTASLDGRVALITGARVKIGFHAALKMLRAGARVLVTTRFPRDAANRFAREADFAEWRERLQIHGLDLRHSPSVEIFARYLERTEERLDILINNAAQTVRRPPGFYAPLLDVETRPLSDEPSAVRALLRGHEHCKEALAASPSKVLPGSAGTASSTADATGMTAWHAAGPGMGIHSPALLSQVPFAYDPAEDADGLFPAGVSDADLQQVDLRAMNSWRLTLDQVPSAEMLEVHLVNAVAPFILASKLKPLMMRQPSRDKHIVNVSAMEGQFARRTKTDKHPHTNMAKAALNMMTLTSAPGYAADGIFMNAVDTGWVTDEDPAALAARKREVHDFQPPLDIVDGAARICDPFFSGLLTGVHVSGKFLKDYAPAPW